MSNRFSTMRGDHIEYGMWLIFDAYGGVRMTRGEPDTKSGERALQLTAKLPKAIFAIPVLRATLAITHDAVAPPHVDIVVAQDALRAVLGVDIDLTVTSQEQPG